MSEYLKVSEVSNLTGIHLMTLYKRVRDRDVSTKYLNGSLCVNASDIDKLKEPGRIGRPKLDKNIKSE